MDDKTKLQDEQVKAVSGGNIEVPQSTQEAPDKIEVTIKTLPGDNDDYTIKLSD